MPVGCPPCLWSRSTRSRSWSGSATRDPGSDPVAGPGSLRQPGPRAAVARNRLARASSNHRRRRHPNQLRRAGRGARSAALRPRPLGLLAELARAGPPLRRQSPGPGPGPAWLRRLADAVVGDHDRGLRRLASRLLRRAGVESCAVVGNSMGGFVAAEAVGREQGRFDRMVLVSAAGVSHAEMRKEPAEALGRVAAATAPMGLKLAGAGVAAAAACARLAFQQVVHRSLRMRRELLWEQFVHGAARPGFLPALTSLVGYDLLRPPGGRRAPDADRLGARRPDRARRRRGGLRQAPAQLAHGDLRGHGPRAAARAAGALQPRARRSSSAVTAPSDADETVAAYLAITPVVNGGLGRLDRRRRGRRSRRRSARPRACGPRRRR